MPATLPHEVEVAGTTLLLAEPFTWPRSFWEVLDLEISDEVGWYLLDDTSLTALLALYNGAHGRVDDGPAGIIVQYVQGTGGGAFTVTDWAGHSGSFVFVPDDGFEYREVARESGVGYYRARLRLVQVA